MLTYNDEKTIAERILSNNSIAYCSSVVESLDLPQKAQASLSDVNFQTPKTSDLFYTRSILVSTSVNLNGDHFHPLQTWAARKTPIDKPTNINHDQGMIIGHITSQWAIDSNNNIIPDDATAEEVPNFFHIANGSVIYSKYPQNPEIQDEVDFLIAQIQEGQKYVSMECLFTDFQYAVQDNENNYMVARNEETSFLSKHLRAYGGTGEFDGMKVSRSLMNINFCGKGFVDEPANKDSIIFAKDKISEFSFANIKEGNPFNRSNGVNFSCKAHFGEKKMAEDKDLEIKELKVAVASLTKELTQADSKALKEKVAELDEAKAEAEKQVSELNEQLAKVVEAKACMCKQVDKVAAENETLKAELDKLKEAAISEARIKVFLDKNFPLEEATAEAEALKSLDETTFAFVSSRIPSKSQDVIAPQNVDESKADVVIEDVVVEEKIEASVDESPEQVEMAAIAARVKAVAASFTDLVKEKEDK